MKSLKIHTIDYSTIKTNNNEKDYHVFHGTLHGIACIECPKQQGAEQSLEERVQGEDERVQKRKLDSLRFFSFP